MIPLRCVICAMITMIGIALNPIAASQNNLLQGPLVVTNTSNQDGFIIYDLGTATHRTLGFGTGEHFFGGFSPDGCEIVFTWEATEGKADLYAARLDGSGLRQLTFVGPTGALSYRAWEPDWSPDGQRIAFTFVRYYDPQGQEPYRTMHIAWVPLTGGSLAFYSNSGNEFQPRWSPDGNWLVYVSNQPILEADNPDDIDATNVRPELWLVSADGQNKQRLVSFTGGGSFNPRWSPDSELIAFVFEPNVNSHQLMIASRDGQLKPFAVNEQQVMVLDYTWQPTGRHLIAAIRGLHGEEENYIWRLPVEMSGNADFEQFIAQPYVDYPRFSADGRWMAFRDAYELAVLDTASGEITTYGNNTLNNSPPVWSPAGFTGEANCAE